MAKVCVNAVLECCRAQGVCCGLLLVDTVEIIGDSHVHQCLCLCNAKAADCVMIRKDAFETVAVKRRTCMTCQTIEWIAANILMCQTRGLVQGCWSYVLR